MFGRKWLVLLALPLGIFLATVLHSGTAHAAPPPFNRGANQGYFTSNNNPTGHNIFGYGEYALPQSTVNNNIDTLINIYGQKLSDGDPKDYIGAAFTILTMLGYPVGTSPSVAVSQFNAWATILRYYNSQGWIGWYVPYDYDYNTYYQVPQLPNSPQGDVAWYGTPGAKSISIVFYNPDGTSYAIKTDCANPVGQMSPLHPQQTQLSCGTMHTDPNSPEVGRSVTITATVTIASGPSGAPQSPSLTVQQQGGGTTNVPVSVNVSGSTITLRGTYNPAQAGWYVVRWTVQVNGQWPTPTNPCGGQLNTYSAFDALEYPFFSVQGGDVIAGASFDNGTVPCSSAPHNQQAGISSWNDSGSPDFNGAGSQYAAMAMNYIQGFITNQGQGPPASMSFANTNQSGSNNQSQQLFGGMFGGVTSCVDYWGKKPDLASLTALPSYTTMDGLGGTYKYQGSPTSPLIIGGTSAQDQIPDNTHITIYVDGNVEIQTPITYADANGWGSEDDIPSFTLIVHGSIFIDPTVGQLDGVYVAVPDHYADAQTTPNSFAQPQAGTITTCGVAGSSPLQSYDPAQVASNGMQTQCNHQLVVNGAFVANQLYLLRTYGTRATNQPAEVFRLGPEAWLTPSQNQVPSALSYQSFTSLPPVL